MFAKDDETGVLRDRREDSRGIGRDHREWPSTERRRRLQKRISPAFRPLPDIRHQGVPSRAINLGVCMAFDTCSLSFECTISRSHYATGCVTGS